MKIIYQKVHQSAVDILLDLDYRYTGNTQDLYIIYN